MSGFFTSPRIAWGPGAFEQFASLGLRRAAVLADARLTSGDGARRLREELARAGSSVDWISNVRLDGSVTAAKEAAARLDAAAPDAVIAWGSGRAIDTAKAALALGARPDLDLASWTPLTELPPSRRRFFAVPTTIGSGAESSGAAYLLDAGGGTVELWHRDLSPEWAFVDPTLLPDLSPDAVRAGGAAVLAHAIEAYVSPWSNPFTNALARDAARTAFAALPRLARHPTDAGLRGELLLASSRAGLAAANAQLGLAHALARALLSETGLPYARLLAIALPVTIAFNQEAAASRYAEIAAEEELADGPVRRPLGESAAALNRLLGVPRTLAELGSTAGAVADRAIVVERVRRSTACLANPRLPSTEQIGTLLDQMIGSASKPL